MTQQTSSPEARLVLPAEQDQAASVLSRAFGDDPVMTWLFAGADDASASLKSFFDLVIQSAITRGHLYRSPGWESVSFWSPPGSPSMFNPEHEPLVGELVVNAIGMDRAIETAQLSELTSAHHPTDPHMYLCFVGVDPSEQGRGHGATVLKPALDLADRNELPAYLESSNPRNIPFYERHGFKVISEFAADGGPPMAGMWRDSQR